MLRIHVRVTVELADKIQRAASERGFDNTSAYVRQAIENELHSGDTGMEQRIAASLDRLGREFRRVQTAQQAEYALLDSFVRLFLMCVPEPAGEALSPARARAAARYSNFLKNVARNMTGHARTALAELLGHD
jgi:hypothetical protein